MECFLVEVLTRREANLICEEIEEEFPWLFDEDYEAIEELADISEKYLSYYERLTERYELN